MAHDRVINRLRELRNIAGMTQAQLAERVGVARVSIVAIENGRFLPTIETALLIGKALNIPVEEIFRLKEDDP